MPTLETYQGAYLWNYVPSLPAAVTFAVLFGLATAAHSWRMSTLKSWFCLPFVCGGLRMPLLVSGPVCLQIFH
jgi:hypothetical protein